MFGSGSSASATTGPTAETAMIWTSDAYQSWTSHGPEGDQILADGRTVLQSHVLSWNQLEILFHHVIGVKDVEIRCQNCKYHQKAQKQHILWSIDGVIFDVNHMK